MFNFNRITHIMENPKGHSEGHNFSLVGSVPASMMEGRKPTQSDAMGGRIAKDGLAYYGRKWETVQSILDAASQHPEVRLCSSDGCACRKLF